MKYENCTFYTTGEFMGNVIRHDCRVLEIDIKPYAQYPAAIHVKFTPKGKRNPRACVFCYRPYLVVVATKHAITPADMMGTPVSSGPDVTVQRSMYRSFDDRWQSDFDALLVAAKVPLLADFRGHDSNQILKPETTEGQRA